MCDGVNGSDDTMAASAVLCAVFMVLLCTVHGQTPAPENGYEFPERFSAIATGFVWDALVGLDEPGESVGYMYTDYSIPAQRVDEVWNYTSILGTHFGARGISSDTHLFFKDSNYLWYNTADGASCEFAPIGGVVPRDLFNSPSAFHGQSTFEGRPAYVYMSDWNRFKNVTLYASVERPGIPLALDIPQLNQGKFWGGSLVLYTNVKLVSSFPDNGLFDPPPHCDGQK